MLPALVLPLVVVAAQSEVPGLRGSVYDPGVRAVGATVALLGVAILVDAEKYGLSGASPCPGRDDPELLCGAGDVNPLDRWVTRESSRGAATASDLLLGAVLSAPLLVAAGEAAFSDFDAPGARFGEDAAVYAEALGLTLLATNTLKLAIQRPRPLTYNSAFARDERLHGDARLSFPSGHSSTSFAAASVLAVGLLERHGESAGVWLGVAGGYTLAAVVAYLRTAAGKHFVTDVLVGAGLGTAIGLGVALSSRRDHDSVAPLVAAGSRAIHPLQGGIGWAAAW